VTTPPAARLAACPGGVIGTRENALFVFVARTEAHATATASFLKATCDACARRTRPHIERLPDPPKGFSRCGYAARHHAGRAPQRDTVSRCFQPAPAELRRLLRRVRGRGAIERVAVTECSGGVRGRRRLSGGSGHTGMT
jgi:hypothetical protein